MLIPGKQACGSRAAHLFPPPPPRWSPSLSFTNGEQVPLLVFACVAWRAATGQINTVILYDVTRTCAINDDIIIPGRAFCLYRKKEYQDRRFFVLFLIHYSVFLLYFLNLSRRRAVTLRDCHLPLTPAMQDIESRPILVNHHSDRLAQI